MINLNELEKVVTSGKVVTLVIMVDGKELAAMSFTLDTVAFKEILETVTKAPVTISEKPILEKGKNQEPMPTKPEQKKPDAKKPVDKNDKTGRHPEFNPTPATAESVKAEQEQEEKEKKEKITVIIPPGTDFNTMENSDDNDRSFDVDENTGESKEPTEEQIKEFEDDRQPENLANKSQSTSIYEEIHENKTQPVVKKTIEPVSAAAMEDDDIIPEETIVTDKKETVNTDLTIGGDEPW